MQPLLLLTGLALEHIPRFSPWRLPAVPPFSSMPGRAHPPKPPVASLLKGTAHTPPVTIPTPGWASLTLNPVPVTAETDRVGGGIWPQKQPHPAPMQRASSLLLRTQPKARGRVGSKAPGRLCPPNQGSALPVQDSRGKAVRGPFPTSQGRVKGCSSLLLRLVWGQPLPSPSSHEAGLLLSSPTWLRAWLAG